MATTDITIDYGWLSEHTGNAKGALGEAIAEVYLRDQLEKKATQRFPNVAIRRVASPHYDVRYHANPVSETGEHEHYTWIADLTFPIYVENYGPERKVIVEVKTGTYAELERKQKAVMGRLARNEKHAVWKCTVTFGNMGFEMQFSELTYAPDLTWRPVEILEQSDAVGSS